MVLRISHQCACMCVRAYTRAQMGVCVLAYLHMYLSTRVQHYPVCMGLYVRVYVRACVRARACTCFHACVYSVVHVVSACNVYMWVRAYA